MPIRTHRETTYPAPRDVVWRAIMTVAPTAVGGVAEENPASGTIVIERGSVAHSRTTFTVTPTTGGTLVRVERELSRGYGHGMWDVFDFFGQEAQKWLFLVHQELERMHAAEPWGAVPPPAVPEGLVPAPIAAGTRVAVIDRAGVPQKGTVRAAQAGRYDVQLDGGGECWFDAHDVHVEPRSP